MWDHMPRQEAADVVSVSDEFKDVADEDQWPAMEDWLMQQQSRFRSALDAVGALA